MGCLALRSVKGSNMSGNWKTAENIVNGRNQTLRIMAFTGILQSAVRIDRVFDVGRVAGEIKHFFMQHTGDGHLAEPFIGHFLWEYACHFPEQTVPLSPLRAAFRFTWGSRSCGSPATHGLLKNTGGSCWISKENAHVVHHDNKRHSFDLYGTLIDIETDESLEEIYRAIAHYLTYQGIYLHRWEVRDRYYAIMKQQKEDQREEFPEVDVKAIWNRFLRQEGIKAPSTRKKLATTLAHLYRAISRKRLRLYPGVKRVLDELRPTYRIAVVSDAQPCWALPEMKAVGINGYFDPIIISANYGFRKPDRRLFETALDTMELVGAEVIYVGNDMYRDICGASQLGIKTIFVNSNQGAKCHENVIPDYFACRFEEVLKGVEALGGALPL